jgi:hypothetical protein
VALIYPALDIGPRQFVFVAHDFLTENFHAGFIQAGAFLLFAFDPRRWREWTKEAECHLPLGRRADIEKAPRGCLNTRSFGQREHGGKLGRRKSRGPKD